MERSFGIYNDPSVLHIMHDGASELPDWARAELAA